MQVGADSKQDVDATNVIEYYRAKGEDVNVDVDSRDFCREMDGCTLQKTTGQTDRPGN